MNLKDMPIPTVQTTARTCGNEKESRGGKTKTCKNLVWLHPGVDPNFMVGECGKCGTPKIVRK